MSGGLDLETLAEKVASVERHLGRVASRLPPRPEDLEPGTDRSDAVVLHLWQATQVVLDVAVSACARHNLGTPETYANAFERLVEAGIVPAELLPRLIGAAGFRNLVAHAYERLDLQRVHRAASTGPADLRAFLAAIRDTLP